MAVVKANAYGHGDVAVARALINEGTKALAVARLGEAIALREAGITQPVLILGYTPPSAAGDLSRYDLTQTVFSEQYARLLNQRLQGPDGHIKIHLKIDTGMGRLGLRPDTKHAGKEATEPVCRAVREIAGLEKLVIEGIYTHFAASDSADKTSALNQLRLFREVISHLSSEGIDVPIKHAANSAAIIDMPETQFDMVRPGIMLYGLYPSDEVAKQNVNLQPAMQLKARIAQVKQVPQGFPVSYGHTYTARQATRIATIPVGYADGYERRLSSAGVMLVKGMRAPVIGRVCMDQTMIDVGHIPDVQAGDEAVIIGKQEGEELTADAMAVQLGTINYEIVSTFMARVHRVFTGHSGQ
jgi:alanine racemase